MKQEKLIQKLEKLLELRNEAIKVSVGNNFDFSPYHETLAEVTEELLRDAKSDLDYLMDNLSEYTRDYGQPLSATPYREVGLTIEYWIKEDEKEKTKGQEYETMDVKQFIDDVEVEPEVNFGNLNLHKFDIIKQMEPNFIKLLQIEDKIHLFTDGEIDFIGGKWCYTQEVNND